MWERRFREHEPMLLAAIEAAKALAPAANVREIVTDTERTNAELLFVENRALEYVRDGRLAEARAILFMPRYVKQHQKYAYSLGALDTALERFVTTSAEIRIRPLRTALFVCGAALPIILLCWWAALRAMHRWRAGLLEHQQRLHLQSQQLLEANTLLDRKVIEHARAQQLAEQASQAKTVFLATMSHEIRTPMNGVLGMTELLLDTPLSHAQRDLAKTIHDSGRALLTVINDVLDISKIEADKLVLEQRNASVATIVHDVIRLLSVSAERKGIRIESTIDPRMPHVLRTDPDRLRQVLLNLVGNAVKFTDRGHVHVSVAVIAEAAEHVKVRVEVRDTGIGIPDDQLRLLFTPFVQLDGSNTRKHGGTGLGLAIVRRLVELMHGETGVSSTPGVGSTFWFTATFATAESASGSMSDRDVPNERPSEPAIQPGSVLVVDDNEVNLKVACRILQRLGYSTIVATNGIEAIERWEQHRPDLILMDCQMPQLDGYEATREIRRRETHRPRTPIIALTADAMNDAHLLCRAAGMDDYLTKPVDRARLTAMLAKHLHEGSPSRAIA
jgi:signal transduction histidine kinase/CheY-like chemotaxis protein